eukprot:GFUD01043629.1.p1 GENE.GFUD01043629.1~~GFUD01043629.1.p1  ORF type:complete len:134 (-),score=28.15 GFUD01043629.1:75-476(-)
MLSTTMRLFMLLSLVTYSTGLKCWHTAPNMNTIPSQYTGLRRPHVPVVMRDCVTSDTEGDTSCMKEWYTVGKMSDVYFKLGCSKTAVTAEKNTAMGTGEKWVYYCGTDYCNSSVTVQPLLGLLLVAAFLVIKQ